jgi:hypothetical protein
MEIRSAVRDYINHINEEAFVASLISANGNRPVLGALDEMLRSRNWEPHDYPDQEAAGLFISDACSFGQGRFQRRRLILRSRLMRTLREQALSGGWRARHNSVRTLEKIGGAPAAVILRAVLNRWIDADPLLVPQIITSVPFQWFKPNVRWRFVEQVARSREALVRWSVLATRTGGMLGYPSNAADSARALPLLQRLSRDKSHWVASEARHRRKIWQLERKGSGVSAILATPPLATAPLVQSLGMGGTGEWVTLGRSNRWGTAQREEPKLTFGLLEMRFHNRMAQQGLLDYSINDLGQFARELAGELGASG